MASQYDLTLASGSPLGTIFALEGNGPNAASIPRQVLDISFETAGNYFVVADDVTARFIPNFGFDVVGGTAYDGVYTVHASLPVTYSLGQTRIPVNEIITPNLFNIIGATSGVNGVFSIEGASNGNFLFYPGSIFTVTGNSFPAANASYTVLSVATSSSYSAIGVVTGLAGKWIIVGNYSAFLQPGTPFRISHNAGGGDGAYTVASVVVNGPNTEVTVVGTIIGTAGSNGVLTPTPAKTRITVTGAIPSGTAADGNATPAAISQLPITNVVSVTNTSPNTFNVIWRVSGNHTNKFTPGAPFLIKGNDFLPYNVVVVASSTYNSGAGLTEIVIVVEQSTTPTPSTIGNILYPAPSVPFGFIQYNIPLPLSALELIGKGSPYYNNTISWGNALQNNAVRMLEHFAHNIPPIAPLSGQLWFDPSVPALQLFGSTKYAVVGVNTGSGIWTITGNQTSVAGLQIGKTVVVYNDTGLSATSFVYTVTNNVLNGANTNITVSPAIGVTANGDGVLYSFDDWHGVVAEGFPVQGNLDMNNYSIANIANAVTTFPYVASLTGWGNNDQEVINLRTADTLYIAKTGGSSASAAARSGTMTGSLNINGASPGGASVIGINVNSAPISMYATAGLDFKAAGSGNITFEVTSTGGISVAGTGNITVAQGNIVATAGHVRVGSGTNQVITQNNTGVAPTITFTTATTNNNVINLNTNMLTGLSNAVGVTDAVSLQFADARYVNVTGDAMTGFLTLSADPTSALHSATKSYVDMFVSGIIWISPMLDPNLFDDTLSAPPTINTFTAYHKTYIVAGTGTGAWAGFNGHLMAYDGATWQSVLGRAVIIGDRLGVFVEPDDDDPLSALPAGGLTGQAGKIATITGVSPYTYTFYTPAEPDAISVKGVFGNPSAYQSPHMGHSYTFRGTHGTGAYGTGYAWIEFSGPQSLVDGSGLRYTSNILNVGAGTGIVVNADDVALAVSNVLSLFNLNTNGIVARTASNTVTARTITGTTNQVTVTDGAGVSANPTISIASNPVLPGAESVTVPTSTTANRPGAPIPGMVRFNTDNVKLEMYDTIWKNIATENFVTAGYQPLDSDLTALASTATTGMYAITAAGSSATRTITGTASNIVVTNGNGVSANPTIDLATVTQGAVGTSFSKIKLDVFGRVTSNVAVVAADITGLVDATYVNVSGDTMTGTLTLNADPTLALHAATKQYVDAGQSPGYQYFLVNTEINTLGAITPGTLYITGTYTNVPLTGGTGTGAIADITVAGGGVTVVTLVNRGLGYTAGDTLSASTANIGGTGSGFSIPVSTTRAQTVFTLTTFSYVLGSKRLMLFVNGVKQVLPANGNYTETSATVFTFSPVLTVGDQLEAYLI